MAGTLRRGQCWVIVIATGLALVTTHLTLAQPDVKTDIEYARVDGTPLLLDAYLPQGPGPFPVVLYVHGGGWGSGDKQADTAALLPLTKGAFVCFSIDYRLAPAHHWPACLDDVKTAIRWVKGNAAAYKGDVSRFAIVGYSAGGQLAFMAALGDADHTFRAIVGMAPPTDLEIDLAQRHGLSKSLQDLLDRPQPPTDAAVRLLRDLSPIHHLHAGLPPILIVHGTGDKSVPFPGSVAFQSAVQTAGGHCEVIAIKDAPHRIADWPKFDADYDKKIATWLQAKLNAPATQP